MWHGCMSEFAPTKSTLDGREAIAEPLLERLLAEFRPELIRLGTIKARPEDKTGALWFGARVTSEVDASSIGGGQTVGFGKTGAGIFRQRRPESNRCAGLGGLNEWAAVMVQPEIHQQSPSLGLGATNNSDNFYLREFSLKLSYANIALEAGREHSGGARLPRLSVAHGSCVSHGYDQIGHRQPFQLPGF